MTRVLFVSLVSLGAAGIAVAVSRPVVPRAPERLVRTNVAGREVPAVLGLPLVAAGLSGVVLVGMLLVATSTGTIEESIAVAWVLFMMRSIRNVSGWS